MTFENKNLKEEISKVLNYFNLRNFDKLILEANKILRVYPDIELLWNILGLTYQNLGNYNKAEEKFLKVLKINPKNLSAINNLGNNYKYVYDFHKAEELFKRSLKIKPDYINALVNYGNLKFETNKFEESLVLFHRAIAINNKVILIHLNLSLVYQAIGDFNKAINHLKVIGTLDPKYTKADKMLSALINYKDEDNHLDLMNSKIKTLDLTDDQKIQLYFALAKAYEDKGEFSQAFNYFDKGNKFKRKKSNYSIDKDTLLFKNIKDLFSNNNFNQLNISPSDKKIIFILGMPRSGTTLIEQIISSHNKVAGAGEINSLNRLVYKYLFNSENEALLTDTNNKKITELKAIPNEYFNYLSHFNFKEEYITDKSLLNFQWIGFIKILFPNSKVINCIRDPKENCLSIYKNFFDYEGPWCYEKKELTEFYNLYLDLMKFWTNKYPDMIYNVKYEELIHNPDSEIKKLVNWLDISWDENCLKFYENKSAIKTLSVNQARKKIYPTSLSLYEKYKPFLKEFSQYFG